MLSFVLPVFLIRITRDAVIAFCSKFRRGFIKCFLVCIDVKRYGKTTSSDFSTSGATRSGLTTVSAVTATVTTAVKK